MLWWFESHFSGRFQSVSVNRTLSTPYPLLYCVAQDSVLGPSLIVLYTYPVFIIVITHSLSHHSFSDNQLYVTGRAFERSNLVLSIQSCISQLHFWMDVEKLKINEDKTETILVHLSSAVPDLIMSLLSFRVCIGFLSVRELITRERGK